jgi:4-hydroxythreonine-4-phosphate dehydrogenase
VSGRTGRLPIALTVGEPGGIGPDITIAAWLRRFEEDVPAFLFLGDADVLARRALAMGVDLTTARVAPEDAVATFADALPCLADSPPLNGTPGVLDPSDAPAIVASIRGAVEMLRAGRAGAVVTNPIHKKALNDIGFPFPGHTEFLAHLAEELFAVTCRSVMMLAGPDLRVVPVTIHIPLAAVPAALTNDLIVRTGEIVARDLKLRFGLAAPRLAVSGLNPHAGEDGMLGHEDSEIVRPAVEALCRAGIDAVGPLSADTMFHPAARSTYDAALCMYHDQALIPIKTLAFDEGVNVTLGLPFIRTSPDHGTALPLAGSGKARPTSLLHALRLADAMSHREAAH